MPHFREQLLEAFGFDEYEIIQCNLNMSGQEYILELAFRLPRQEACCIDFNDDCSFGGTD